MAATIVRVDGAKQLRASMKAAGEDLSDLKEVNAQAARTVSAAAVPRTPVRTGRLAASIRPSGTKTAAIVRAGRSSIPYAGVIEFGWPGHNIEAQPYVTTAAADTQPTWESTYQQAIDRIVARIRGES